MAEFRWDPSPLEDERTLGPRRLPSEAELERQTNQLMAEMFPEGWRERLKDVRSKEVDNG